MATNKPAQTIADQITLLKQRGMLFYSEQDAAHYLANISYYRLKGYWWDLQSDAVNHRFKPNVYFEDVLERYNFDRQLRLLVFDAIERIEIGLRTRLIYYPCLTYGSLWFEDAQLFVDTHFHQQNLNRIYEEVRKSKEVFITDHQQRFGFSDTPDAWKSLEVVSLGTLSKLYKNLQHQLPEKALIATSLGLENHSQLSSWLESITHVRNIIAHHSRLWNRKLVKSPKWLGNPQGRAWLKTPPPAADRMRLFFVLSCVLYLNNIISPGHHIKEKLFRLFNNNPGIPLHAMGFPANWQNEPLWRR